MNKFLSILVPSYLRTKQNYTHFALSFHPEAQYVWSAQNKKIHRLFIKFFIIKLKEEQTNDENACEVHKTKGIIHDYQTHKHRNIKKENNNNIW